MTASMIVWTLELLEWIKAQLCEGWPEAKLRGSAPDVDPTPYRIRIRDKGQEFWLTLLPTAMCNTDVAEVRSLLNRENWIQRLRETGSLSVGVQEQAENEPVLHPW